MNMKRFGLGIIMLAMFLITGCSNYDEPVSSSGVKKTTVSVPTNADGRTVEQENIRSRLLLDNKPGSIKHLYVISAYSGDVILYSTVRGKVTSGGKRLTPTTVSGVYTDLSSNGRGHRIDAFRVDDLVYLTNEVIQDDGTYGSSMDYLYWFDTKGNYHQHYVGGGQIVHVSDVPIVVKKPIINLELTMPEEGEAQPQTPQVEETPASVQK